MADAFGESLKLFAEKVDGRLVEMVQESAIEVSRSVTEGSEITGAPGQPVDTGTLKGNWLANQKFVSDIVWETWSNLDYAEPIEEGVGPYGQLTLRSAVGGFHSVAMTRAGWQRIVDYVRSKVVPDG